MPKIQSYINNMPMSNRARASLRAVFDLLFNVDVDPPTLKTGLVLDLDGTTGIQITSAFTGTTMISLEGTASADGILVSGVCADGIHISGNNTVAGLHISADQAVGILLDVDAAWTDGIKMSVDDGITVTTGINIDRSGTTGICTTAISIDTDGTTGITLAAGFTGVTGISILGTCSTAALQIGADGSPSGDFLWYGTTANYVVTFDANGDTNGSVLIGADTYGLMFNLYGDTTGCGVFWDPSDDTNGRLSVGAAGGSKGVDLILYGDTNGCYVHWNRSDDDLSIVGTAARVLHGADGAGNDVIFYGATASYAMTWDADGDTNGSLLIGADTYGILVSLFGDTTGCGVFWDPSGDTNGTLAVGAAGGSKGVDFILYGDTNGAYVQWDRSTDDLIFAGAAQCLVSSGALSVGADGAAGTITVYPGTSSKGTTTITMNDNTGDTLTNIDVAQQAGARTITIPDAGASASVVLMTAGQAVAGTLTRADLTEEALAVYGIPLALVRQEDGIPLVVAETAGTLNLVVSSDVWYLKSEISQGETETSEAVFQFILPPEYVAAGDVKVRIKNRCVLGSGTNNGSTLDVEVFEQDGNGAIGADLCTTVAQTYAGASAWQTSDFVVTAAGLVAGDILNVVITTSVIESGGANPIHVELDGLAMLLDIKG